PYFGEQIYEDQREGNNDPDAADRYDIAGENVLETADPIAAQARGFFGQRQTVGLLLVCVHLIPAFSAAHAACQPQSIERARPALAAAPATGSFHSQILQLL